MAVSNIFNEPRREITETVVGVAAFGLLGWADYAFAVWLERMSGYMTRHDGSVEANMPWFIGLIIGFVAPFAFMFLIMVVHGAGDILCTLLEIFGVQMRPRNRPGR